VKRLIDDLARYGVFVVEIGELESWLPAINAHGEGPEWVMSAFAALGDDPGAPGYVAPSTDDVWEFLDRVAVWTANPSRQGIP